MRKLTLVKTLLIGSLICLAGCNDMKAFGVSPWPIYKEPAPLTFSADEQAALVKFATEQPELFKKIQGQSHSYRAIVQTHNKKALEINKKQLEALGYDEKTVRQVYPDATNTSKPSDPVRDE